MPKTYDRLIDVIAIEDDMPVVELEASIVYLAKEPINEPIVDDTENSEDSTTTDENEPSSDPTEGAEDNEDDSNTEVTDESLEQIE